MYKIAETPFGFQLTFSDTIKKEEMQKWHDESIEILKKYKGKKFGVLIDMREFKPLPPESQEIMTKGQKIYKDTGMERSCVVLADPLITMQFQRLGKQSGIYAFERYIDVKTHPDNWHFIATQWLNKAVDPDKK